MISSQKPLSSGEMLRVNAEIIRGMNEDDFIQRIGFEFSRKPAIPMQWVHIAYSIGSVCSDEFSSEKFFVFIGKLIKFREKTSPGFREELFSETEKICNKIDEAETLKEMMESFESVDFSEMRTDECFVIGAILGLTMTHAIEEGMEQRVINNIGCALMETYKDEIEITPEKEYDQIALEESVKFFKTSDTRMLN